MDANAISAGEYVTKAMIGAAARVLSVARQEMKVMIGARTVKNVPNAVLSKKTQIN